MRSPHAHARVTDIDVTDALDVEGLVAIYTYDDLLAADETEGTAVAEPLPLLIPHPSLHAPRTGYALARDEVNHVGEAVVMVVARGPLPRRGRRRPGRRDLRAAARSWSASTTPAGPSAPCTTTCPTTSPRTTSTRSATSTAALAAAPHTLSLSLDIERSASMPMEGKGVHARWDPVDSSMRVHSSTQTSTSVRAAVAAKLALPLGKVECVAPMSAAASA